MSLNHAVAAIIGRTRGLPAPVRYATTLAIVFALFLLRHMADPVLPPSYPFLMLFLAMLLSCTLFDHGAGLFATLVSAALATHADPALGGVAAVDDGRDMVDFGPFVAIGALMAVTIESLHRALAEAQGANAALRAAHAELARSERSRALLLQEFRHRTRNDLGSLVAMLRLRARSATSAAAREGLQEAAEHSMALARVHTWLALADAEDMASVDTRGFLRGHGCGRAGKGLRPVALVAEAEAHRLVAERAVQLGLVLNEAVTNALKYAFREERPGAVCVRFVREAECYVLTVTDDGTGLPIEGDVERAPACGLPPGSGLGTRLLRGLAAQLRGPFTRRPDEGGGGTVAELRFPVCAAR